MPHEFQFHQINLQERLTAIAEALQHFVEGDDPYKSVVVICSSTDPVNHTKVISALHMTVLPGHATGVLKTLLDAKDAIEVIARKQQELTN